MGDTKVVQNFRDFLQIRKVFVPKDGRDISANLMTWLKEEEKHEWTDKEISMQLKSHGKFWRNPKNIDPDTDLSGVDPFHPRDETPKPGYSELPAFNPSQGQNASNMKVGLLKLLVELVKLYSNEMKYTGEIYDILDVKLQIFYDCCRKIGIPKDQLHEAFSVMLRGRAHSFYYDKVTNRKYNFETMISLMRTHFKTEKNCQLYLAE